MEIFTPAKALGPTPLPTKAPSTIVYREKNHMAPIDGKTNFLNCFFVISIISLFFKFMGQFLVNISTTFLYFL